MNTLKKIKILVLVIVILNIAACKKEKGQDDLLEVKLSKEGVYISCEGPFNSGTGTISWYDRTNKETENDLFEKVNGRALGNIVQSIEIFGNKAYILVNNAAKMEIVNALTFKSVATVTGLIAPRYFMGITSEKGYVSDWANNIAVINLSNYKIIKTIPTATGPDKMLKYNNKVFVLNGGGWGCDSLITVIDCINDEVILNLKVFDRPTGICLDKNNKLWVLCSGKGFNGFPDSSDSRGHILRINPDNYLIEKNIVFLSKNKHPEKLIINQAKDLLYYNYYNGVYKFDISIGVLNAEPLIKKSFYNIGYDTKNDCIYGADPVDYAQNGWVFIYNAKTAMKKDSIKVGIIPGEFYFN